MKKLVILLTVILAGCVTAGNPSVKDESKTSQIHKGVTTKQEVKELLGMPQSITTSDGVETWGYSYVHAQATGVSYIPIVGIFAGGATSESNSISLEFNEDDVVKKITTGHATAVAHNFGGTQTTPDKKQEQ